MFQNNTITTQITTTVNDSPTNKFNQKNKLNIKALSCATTSLPTSVPHFLRLNPHSRSMVDHVRQEFIAALFETDTIKTGAILYGS